MTALYTGQINFYGARLLHGTDVWWLGTSARDQISPLKHERRPFALIINTDKAAGPGENWLAFYARRSSDKIEMFDLIGLPADFTHSINHLFIVWPVAYRH